MKKRLLVTALVLGAIVMGVFGGVVVAQGKDRQQTEGKPHRLTVRMAEILGLEHGRVEQAFNQALGELRDERASSYLSRLVETGKITQEQAEEKLEWLKANPDVKAGFQKKGMHRFLHNKGEGKGDWHRKRFK